MKPARYILDRGVTGGLCIVLAAVLLLQITPGLSTGSRTALPAPIPLSCSPSCDPTEPPALHLNAALLPVGVPATSVSPKRFQPDASDLRTFGSWTGRPGVPGAEPRFFAPGARLPENVATGARRLCTLLCTYRL